MNIFNGIISLRFKISCYENSTVSTLVDYRFVGKIFEKKSLRGVRENSLSKLVFFFKKIEREDLEFYWVGYKLCFMFDFLELFERLACNISLLHRQVPDEFDVDFDDDQLFLQS